MTSNNCRSMLVALLFCLSGAASAQSIAPASMPAVSAEVSEVAPVVTPEASAVTTSTIDDSGEGDKHFAEGLRSTVLYQRMYVRITLHSTPEWRAR